MIEEKGRVVIEEQKGPQKISDLSSVNHVFYQLNFHIHANGDNGFFH